VVLCCASFAKRLNYAHSINAETGADILVVASFCSFSCLRWAFAMRVALFYRNGTARETGFYSVPSVDLP